MGEFLGFFLVGGTVVALTTLLGTRGHGPLAAFISMFPCMTVLIFVLLYRGGGTPAVTGYAKNLIYFVGPWAVYVLIVSLLCERIGIWWALGLGIGAYMALAWVAMQYR